MNTLWQQPSLPVILASPLTYAAKPLVCALQMCTNAELAMEHELSSFSGCANWHACIPECIPVGCVPTAHWPYRGGLLLVPAPPPNWLERYDGFSLWDTVWYVLTFHLQNCVFLRKLGVFFICSRPNSTHICRVHFQLTKINKWKHLQKFITKKEPYFEGTRKIK